MIVTLLTDFGTTDHYVGVMKGVILGRSPGATLVDITHQVPPQDVAAGAFVLRSAYPAFPPGTVHLAVVDPGVGSARRPIAVAAGGQLFVGPDNGLFTHVYRREPGARVFHLADPRFFLHPVSNTFHGRDIFAPVAGALSHGTRPEELGPEVADAVHLPLPLPPTAPPGGVAGSILHIDRFGNCVTTLARAEVPHGLLEGGFQLRVGGHEIRALRRFFAAEGEEDGEAFALWGSSELLEIAVNGGSAAERLGLRRGDAVLLLPG